MKWWLTRPIRRYIHHTILYMNVCKLEILFEYYGVVRTRQTKGATDSAVVWLKIHISKGVFVPQSYNLCPNRVIILNSALQLASQNACEAICDTWCAHAPPWGIAYGERFTTIKEKRAYHIHLSNNQETFIHARSNKTKQTKHKNKNKYFASVLYSPIWQYLSVIPCDICRIWADYSPV